MGFMQWFWKYGYFIVPLIVALGWFLSSDKFQDRNKVNPAIFAYFKQVEEQCLAEEFNNRSSGCVELEKFQTECLKISASCDSKSHYDLILKLGFNPPSYYQ